MYRTIERLENLFRLLRKKILVPSLLLWEETFNLDFKILYIVIILFMYIGIGDMHKMFFQNVLLLAGF